MSRLTANSFDDPAWVIVMKGWDEYTKCRFDESIADYTAALNSFNACTPIAATVETYICRGVAFARAGNEHAAIDDFTRAIALDSQQDIAFYDRGIARQMLELYDLAIDDFSRAIELRPTCVSSYIRRGICRKRLNEIEGARRDFAEARRLIAAEKQADQPKTGLRPKTLADVPLRFPPPPGTRFYVCFARGPGWDGRPLEENPTVVADSPQDALDQLLRDGKAPTDPSLNCAQVVWIDHNRNSRCCIWWLNRDDKAGTT